MRRPGADAHGRAGLQPRNSGAGAPSPPPPHGGRRIGQEAAALYGSTP